MKKLVLLFCAASTVLLSGCAAEDVFKDEPELTSLIGILTEQKSTDSVAGTHLLETEENGEAIMTPIRSLSVNLSSQNYLDNKVQVIGFLNQDDGVFEVTGISVIEALHDLEKDPEFVEYKNTDFGIQLKYYEDWEVDETDSSVTFEKDGFYVMIHQEMYLYEPTISPEGEQDTPIDAYAGEIYIDLSDDELVFNKIGVDALDALKIEELDGVTYHLYRDGLIYTIQYHGSGENTEQMEKYFKEMLAEFKFTGFTVEDEDDDDEEDVDEKEDEESIVEDPSEELVVPDMKFATYESLPLLFAGEYPASWYYAGSSGSGSGIIRHYGFSDESVTDSNEFISLDILTSDIPSGKTIAGDGKTLTFVESGGTTTVYSPLEEKTFKFSGDSEYKDIMVYMANSIFTIEAEEE